MTRITHNFFWMKASMKRSDGAVLMIVMILFVVISLSISVGLVVPAVHANRIAEDGLQSNQSYYFAESGVEDALYRLRAGKQVAASNTLVLGSISTTTTVATVSGGKQITALGNSYSRDRTVSALVSQAQTVTFASALQAGRGGVSLTGGASVTGNILSAGNVTSDSSGVTISGSVVAANSDALTTDQTNGSGTPTYNISFGPTTATQDIAQSFTVSVKEPLNKIQLYLKKVGSPANATVRIVSDSSGSPSTNVLATGTLLASSVATTYGWVDATVTTSPMLSTSTTYWVVVDSTTSASNYYVAGANDSGYANGVSKIGQYGSTWSNNTPSTLDLYLNVLLGGVTSTIAGVDQYNTIHIGGSATAATVNYSTVTGSIYCLSSSFNNKSCISQTPPTASANPLPDATITAWKAAAAAGTITTGNQSYSGGYTYSFGPSKIVGDLTVTSGATVNLTGIVWVTGNLTVSGGTVLGLSSAMGTASSVIVVDGLVSITSGGTIRGSGTSGSNLIVVSTSDCPTSSSCGGSNAILINGGSTAPVLIAQNGTVYIVSGPHVKSATGYMVSVSGGTAVVYDSTVTSPVFSSTTSSGWTVQTWKETP